MTDNVGNSTRAGVTLRNNQGAREIQYMIVDYPYLHMS